jgi:hypothetical protein
LSLRSKKAASETGRCRCGGITGYFTAWKSLLHANSSHSVKIFGVFSPKQPPARLTQSEYFAANCRQSGRIDEIQAG